MADPDDATGAPVSAGGDTGVAPPEGGAPVVQDTEVIYLGKADNVSATTSITIDTPPGAVEGTILIASLTTTSVITPPAGWNLIQEQPFTSRRTRVMWYLCPEEPPASHTFAISGFPQTAGVIAAFGNVHPESPILESVPYTSGVAQATAVLGSFFAPAGSMLVGTVGGTGVETSWAAPASMVARGNRDGGSVTNHLATELLAVSGDTGTRTFTPNASTTWGGVLLALRPAETPEEQSTPFVEPTDVKGSPVAAHGDTGVDAPGGGNSVSQNPNPPTPDPPPEPEPDSAIGGPVAAGGDTGAEVPPGTDPIAGVYSIPIPAQSSVRGAFDFDELDFGTPEEGAHANRLFKEAAAQRIRISAGVKITRVQLTVTISTTRNWEIGVMQNPTIEMSPNDPSPAPHRWDQEFGNGVSTLSIDETMDMDWPTTGYLLVNTYSSSGNPTLPVTGGMLTVTWEVI